MSRRHAEGEGRASGVLDENLDEEGVDESEDTSPKKSLRETICIFFKLAKPYFYTQREGTFYLLAVILLTLVSTSNSVLFSYVMKDFWDSLAVRDLEGMHEQNLHDIALYDVFSCVYHFYAIFLDNENITKTPHSQRLRKI